MLEIQPASRLLHTSVGPQHPATPRPEWQYGLPSGHTQRQVFGSKTGVGSKHVLRHLHLQLVASKTSWAPQAAWQTSVPGQMFGNSGGHLHSQVLAVAPVQLSTWFVPCGQPQIRPRLVGAQLAEQHCSLVTHFVPGPSHLAWPGLCDAKARAGNADASAATAVPAAIFSV